MLNAALMSSARPDWNTPREIVDLATEFFGGKIACDPCSNPGSIVGARVEYMLERGENGLELPWFNGTYINPPYGRSIGEWTSRAAGSSVDVVGLLPARTDARWWQRDVFGRATAICFVRGRLKFLGAPASAPFPSAIVYWDAHSGVRDWQFEDVFGRIGRVVKL